MMRVMLANAAFGMYSKKNVEKKININEWSAHKPD